MRGCVAEIEATSSRASMINTNGDCTGHYYATGSEAAIINHVDSIKGRIRQKRSEFVRSDLVLHVLHYREFVYDNQKVELNSKK